MNVPDGLRYRASDDLDAYIAEQERTDPGFARGVADAGGAIDVTTTLWQRREELGMSVEEVAERSGLSDDEVGQVEDNAVDAALVVLVRYAQVVGLTLRAVLG